MRKWVVVLCVCAMFFCFTGCSDNKVDNGNNITNEVNNSDNQEINEALGSKTAKLMSGDYYIKYNTEYDGIKVSVEATKKGDKTATLTDSPEGVVRTICDAEYVYSIMDGQKTIMKTPINANPTIATELEYFNEEEMVNFTTGNEVVNGVDYYFEDFGDSKFYFLNNELKMIKAEELLIEISEFSNKANESMLEIPNNYTDLSVFTSGNTVNIPEEYLQYVH